MWHFVSACHSVCSPSVIKLCSLKCTLICVTTKGATAGDGSEQLQFSDGAPFCLVGWLVLFCL